MIQPMRASDVKTSEKLASWWAEQNMGLALTTFSAQRLLTFGTENDGRIALCESVFDVPRALWSDGKTILISSRSRMHRLTYGAAPGRLSNHEERLYCPRTTFLTGELDIADITRDAEGRVVFVNTQFNCLATLDEKHSFRPIWRPPFISKLAAENRCHLSGLALRNGLPAFVTAFAATDDAWGYLQKQRDGGCIVDVAANKIIAEGLSLPRSPRFYQDKLWLLQSGMGELGYWDFERRVFERLAFCPGMLESLTFYGHFAIVSFSLPQSAEHVAGLPIEQTMKEKRLAWQCGVDVIDLRTGEATHAIRLGGDFREASSVAVLEGIKKPLVLTFA